MKLSKRNLVISLTILLIFLCAVVLNLVTGGRLALMLFSFSDISPPHASFSFITEDGHLYRGSVVVAPNEPFTPLVDVYDDYDPSPAFETWISIVSRSAFEHDHNEDEGDPIEVGKVMTIEKAGLYSLYVRVADEAGNEMVYSTIVSVYNKFDQTHPYQLPSNITFLEDPSPNANSLELETSEVQE